MSKLSIVKVKLDREVNGYIVTCASLASGTIKCWGDNLEGLLGTASVPVGSSHMALTPVTVDGITTATSRPL